jgi:ABC-type bacteriocin/lantibiotic exporter with double-glycine peptidase domain
MLVSILSTLCFAVLGAASDQSDDLALEHFGATLQDTHEPFDYWRAPEYDGTNCLFLLLRSAGYLESYSSYRLALQRNRQTALTDFTMLSAAARLCGYRAIARKMTMDELVGLDRPAIIQLEGDDGYHFVVVAAFRANDGMTIVGGRSALKVLSRDQIRKRWTGYALLGEKAPMVTPAVRRALAIVMLAVTLTIAIMRSGK